MNINSEWSYSKTYQMIFQNLKIKDEPGMRVWTLLVIIPVLCTLRRVMILLHFINNAWNNKQNANKGEGVPTQGVQLGKSVFPQQLPFSLLLCVSWYYRITCQLIDCRFWILIKNLLSILFDCEGRHLNDSQKSKSHLMWSVLELN